MIVRALEFSRFRNLCDNRILPSEGINVILGDNAQGKTNLLEAVWLFSGGHSFRGSKENELIRIGEINSSLKMNFYSQEREQEASIRFLKSKKEVELNGVKKPSSAYLSQCFSAVVFSPEHLSLVKGGPSLRRKFIDGAICQQDIKYAVLLSKYQRTVFQRNTLLKDIARHPELKETLSVWDDAIIAAGAKIIEKRIKYLGKLQKSAFSFHKGISSDKEELTMEYLGCGGINIDDNLATITDKLYREFEKNRREDIYTGCTSTGPHRDDIEFYINGLKVRTYGSQGQQRSVVLSLKLAESELLREYFGEPPVVLLDDVLSEIDRNRQEFLLSNTRDSQTFITGCEAPVVKNEENKIFLIENGEIK